ncbi:MAG: sigma-54-dependent Fis family transcriptional regulator [Acidobacteria bacterium]|nr:MAG: sigma-54-dependent Fis family transcriptional regulator [Acidobacteriota bacterium]
MHKILVIDDDKSICESLSLYLSEEGFSVGVAYSAQEGSKKSQTEKWDVIILDILLSDADGLDVLSAIKERDPDTSVIMITAFHDMPTTVRAMKLGAVEYIHKPLEIDELQAAIDRVLKRKAAGGRKGQDTISLSLNFREHDIVGKSKAMKEIFKTIGIVSESKTTVLIEGESGTGKELIARAIHEHTDKTKPFISINCSAIVETLLESELFGHERGAFTGATYRKLGKFELADSGTLFLDEIGDMSLNMQVKLLRVMQEREFERVGGKEKIKTDVRIITATNKSLQELVAQGGFREDLYYRLNVIQIYVPPLRERREDIPLLVDYLIHKLNRELNKRISQIQSRALQSLLNRDWPGNIRQLENVLRRAVVHSHGEVLLEESLAESVGDISKSDTDLASSSIKLLDEVEKEHILNALKFARGNRGKVCELLGISRPTLQRKIRKYGIEV